MKVYFKNIILFLLLTILFSLIIFLVYKIYLIRNSRGKVKGINVIKINKDYFSIDNQSEKLKEFYEPIPNRIETTKPSWLGFEIKYTINSDTLNERYEYTPQKLPRTYRIITLGDSFTYGSYVNTFENYSERLEDMLNTSINCSEIDKFEVINLGVLGYDITYEVERFKKRGVKYNPDIVFWLVNFWNFDKVQEYIIPLYKKYEKEGVVDFDPKKGAYPRSDLAYSQINKEYGLNNLLNFTKENMMTFKELFQNKLIIFGSPDEINKKQKNIINELINLNPNYKYIEKLTQFWDHSRYRLLDHHPNAEGHEIIAKGIFDYLFKNELEDCKLIK